MLGDESLSRTHNSQFNHPYGYQPAPPLPDDNNQAPVKIQSDADYELKVNMLYSYSLIDLLQKILNCKLHFRR